MGGRPGGGTLLCDAGTLVLVARYIVIRRLGPGGPDDASRERHRKFLLLCFLGVYMFCG